MKAYAYVEKIGLSDLKLVTRPDPEPGPNDIVLRMRAVSLNYRDLAIARGNYHVGVEPPLIPVSDGAGEVVAAGDKVSRFRIGDLVCPIYMPDWIDGPITPQLARRRLGGPSDGMLAELVCLHEAEAVRAPSHLTAEEAATLPVAALTAWHSLYEIGTVRPGDVVLVQGTGGVSVAAMQFAKAGGARVIGWTRDKQHVTCLRELGVDDVLTAADLGDWPKRVRSLTAGRGADVAVNVAGGATLAHSIAASRVGGQIHLVGYAADTTATIDIFDAIRHATTIHVATAGHRRSFEDMVRAMELQAIRPPIGRSYPLSRLADAFSALSQGGRFGKIVLTF